jgi:multidrug transporter EmrE-like cation transporter
MLNSGYIFILMTSIFTVIGQLIIKWRIDSMEFSLNGALVEKIISIVMLLFDKYIMIGLFSAVLAALFWMAALSKFNLSHAYPMIIALLTILTVVSSVVILGESLPYVKVIGVTIVLIGLMVLWVGDVYITSINHG